MTRPFSRRFPGVCVVALLVLIWAVGLTPEVRAQAIDSLEATNPGDQTTAPDISQIGQPALPEVLPSRAIRGMVGDLQVPGSLSVPLNQRVLQYVSLFQGRLHDFMEDGMRRGSKYLPMIQSVLRAEGLPIDLAYRPARRERLQPERALQGPGQGRLAIHERHCP
jgi:hypothetical protein